MHQFEIKNIHVHFEGYKTVKENFILKNKIKSLTYNLPQFLGRCFLCQLKKLIREYKEDKDLQCVVTTLH